MSRAALRRLSASVVVAAAIPALAVAQPVLLEIRPTAGDTLHLVLEQVVEMIGVTRVGARDSTMSVTTSMSIIARAIILMTDSAGSRVLAVTDSVAVSGPPPAPGNAADRSRRALQGTRAEMRVFSDGSSQIISDASAMTSELRSLVAQMPATLPRTAVQVGDIWSKVVTVPIEAQGRVVGSASLKTTFRFDSLSRNKVIAYLSMSGELSRSAAEAAADTSGVEMTGTLKGELQIDRARGWMTSSRAVIKLRSVLPPPPGSRANSMRFNLTITQRMRALDKR